MAAEVGSVVRPESRRMVSDFFVKSLNVILGARVPSRYLDMKQASSSSIDNTFNLLLVNSPLRTKCHLSVLEPIIVDVLLLQHDPNNKTSGGGGLTFDNITQEDASLIERWVVQCIPSPSTARKSPHACSPPGKGTSKPPSYRAPEEKASTSSSQASWKKVMRMLSMMVRSLYSLTRMLPAYRLFQQLNGCTTSGCQFDLSYKVRSTLVASDEGERCSSRLRKFSLTPVETELGRMCVVVKYSSWESVDKAIQRSGSSIFSDIIHDYVGGESNPHYAVSDRRLSVGTRTKSSNIPLAAVAKATGEGVRRSYSSPLSEQLVCPFVSDDELENCRRMEPICCVQGTSRDAAVGALVTALRQANPIQQGSKLTLGMALQELKSKLRVVNRSPIVHQSCLKTV